MDKNIETITKFYIAFQQLDFKTMNSCYANDIPFSDPVFGLLQGNETKAMWQMLCKNAKNFSLTFDNIITDDGEYYNCNWVASYVFSKTNKPVINKCKAYMRLKNGVILEHSDAFNFYKWSKQAFGITGWWLGWTSYFQKKVSLNARKNLYEFIEKNNLK